MQADAVSAYLAALQDTEVYATPPAYWNKLFPNNQAPPGSLLLLLRALYGLCGSARAWGRLLNNILREFNMQQSLHDPCFFIGNAAYLIVHTDDFLVSCAAESIYDDLLDQLGTLLWGATHAPGPRALPAMNRGWLGVGERKRSESVTTTPYYSFLTRGTSPLDHYKDMHG